MREVQWVIFDEIHYMRDKGMQPQPNIEPLQLSDVSQLVVSFGKKLLFYFRIKSAMSFCLQRFPMQCSLPSGYPKYIISHVTLCTQISDLHLYNITSSLLGLTEFTWLLMRRVYSVRITSRKR